MAEDLDRTQIEGEGSSWMLDAAAFAMALSLSTCWTAMPFVLRALSATEGQVGYALAAHGLGYTCGLLLTIFVLHHLPMRRTTRLAATVALSAAVVMSAAVYTALGKQGGAAANVWTIIAAGSVSGGSLAFFWPFLMSWVSARHEGKDLNRRLGRYNGSWASGALIGPLVGGGLAGVGPLWPILATAVFLVSCLAFLAIARGGLSGDGSSQQTQAPPVQVDDPRLRNAFRWIARIGLFISWAALAVARSQFALLFKNAGFSEFQFGILAVLFGICNVATLMVAGKSVFWHYRFWMLAAAQLLLVGTCVLIIMADTLALFLLSSAPLGIALGFTYGSHLYYGVSGSARRSRRMALHEITISLGTMSGAYAGGVLAEHVGVYAPYWFGIIGCGLGLVVQAVICLVAKVRTQAPEGVAQRGVDRSG